MDMRKFWKNIHGLCRKNLLFSASNGDYLHIAYTFGHKHNSFAIPVELLLLGAKIDAIVGFNSSVLYNAAKMKLCDDISSYMFNDEHYINAESIESNKTLAAMFGEAG